MCTSNWQRLENMKTSQIIPTYLTFQTTLTASKLMFILSQGHKPYWYDTLILWKNTRKILWDMKKCVESICRSQPKIRSRACTAHMFASKSSIVIKHKMLYHFTWGRHPYRKFTYTCDNQVFVQGLFILVY